MPITTRFVPHKSTVHRIAAIALYRALITQASAAHILPAAERTEISNIVRNRFRATCQNQSLRQLRVYFDAGYEALDHLDVVVAGSELAGDDEIQRRRTIIESLLETTPEHMKLPETHDWRDKRKKELRDNANLERWTQELLSEGLPVTTQALGRKKLRYQTRKEDERLRQAWLLQQQKRTQRRLRQRRLGNLAQEGVHSRGLPAVELTKDPDPDSGSQPRHAKAGLDRRPLPKAMLSGHRRIPRLFSANMVPVLRFGRPQPVALSIYLRKAVERRQRRTDNRLRLEAEYRLAELEDQWDAALSLSDSGSSTASTSPEPPPNDNNSDSTTQVPSDQEMSYSRPTAEWRQPVTDSLKQISRQITAEYNRRIDMAANMQRIVDEEVALKAEEKRMAQRQRQQLRQAQQDKEGPNVEGSQQEQPRG